jgi:hypothetical protein
MLWAHSGGISCWLIVFRSGLLSPPPHGFSIPDFWTIGWQERKYAAHSCLFSIDKLVLETGESNESYEDTFSTKE